MALQNNPTSSSPAERKARVESSLILDTPPWREEHDTATLSARMSHYGIPGVSIAVINDGAVEWAQGYGLCDATESRPAEVNTLFQAGSISKTATALAALRLCDTALLSLDENVNTFLQSWLVPANGSWQPRLTLRQLLSHTAGTTVNGFPGYLRGDELPSLLQILNGEKPANNRPIRANFIPGTQFRYSGGGTTIVQQLLIDITGKPFPDLMRDLLLDPLGMAHSTFQQPLPDSLAQSAATGHYWVRKQPVAGRWHTYPEMAAAGLWTTAPDLAQLAIAIQHSIAGNPGAFLTRESAQQMLTPQAGSAGLGLINVKTVGNATRFGHTGGTQGYNADLVAYTTPQVGTAIMTNGFIGEALMDEITRAVAREYNWPNQTSRQAITIEPSLLADYTGTYEFASGVHWKVTQEGDTLCLHPTGQPPFELLPRSNTNFFARAVTAEITFAPAQGGSATEMLLNQDGQARALKRIS